VTATFGMVTRDFLDSVNIIGRQSFSMVDQNQFYKNIVVFIKGIP